MALIQNSHYGVAGTVILIRHYMLGLRDDGTFSAFCFLFCLFGNIPVPYRTASRLSEVTLNSSMIIIINTWVSNYIVVHGSL
jgi:hypothetical protein